MTTPAREIYLEDFVVGQPMRSTLRYTIPKEESVAFARQWDPQPFHLDEEAAKLTYGGLTACSAYIFSVFCKESSTIFENSVVQAIAGLGFDEMRIHRPLFVGETIYVDVEVVENRRSRTKPDRGIVSSMNRMYNQQGELIFSIRSTAMIKARTLC